MQINLQGSTDQSKAGDGEMSGVPPRLIRGAYNTLAAYDKSLTIHVSVLDLVVLVDAVRGIDYQGALLPFLLGEWLGATYILQHDFARGRDVCPVGTDVAVNISWRI